MATVAAAPMMTSTIQAIRGAGGLLSLESMKRTSHTAKVPIAYADRAGRAADQALEQRAPGQQRRGHRQP